jgi:hypothetical protein
MRVCFLLQKHMLLEGLPSTPQYPQSIFMAVYYYRRSVRSLTRVDLGGEDAMRDVVAGAEGSVSAQRSCEHVGSM